MKQQKMTGYRPNYPRRILKGAVLTTAAIMALGASAACTELRTGGVPMPTDEVQLDGYMMPEPTPEPTEEALRTEGEIAVDEQGAEDVMPTPESGELMLSGDVMIAPEQP